MAHFTQENTRGYTDEELEALNAEFESKLAWYLAENPEVEFYDLAAWIKAYDERVAKKVK